jgi:hypothetical protein
VSVVLRTGLPKSLLDECDGADAILASGRQVIRTAAMFGAPARRRRRRR